MTAIDATDWAAGVYVWKVYADGKLAETGKWIKEWLDSPLPPLRGGIVMRTNVLSCLRWFEIADRVRNERVDGWLSSPL